MLQDYDYSMSRFRAWLSSLPDRQFVDLFDVDGCTVRTHLKGKGQRRLLRRSAPMERAVIDIVEPGMQDPDWLGLLYVMGWGPSEHFRPLYVGKGAKAGVKNKLSANLTKIRTNKGKFARWGDGLSYHIGDLTATCRRSR
jgi:hypothetical protein